MKKSYFIIVCLLFGFSSGVFADGELNMKLNAPSVTAGASTSAVQKAETKAVNAPSPKKETKKTAEKKTIGKLGVVTVESAPIYTERSTSSRVYFIAKEKKTLAITIEKDGWYGVFMSNGKTGWIHKNNVEIQDYNVTAPKSTARATKVASRGDFDSNNRIASFLTSLPEIYKYTSYVYGGTSVEKGMDCSAFVRMVFSESWGINLPRTAREQANVGVTVPLELLAPGDRLYFRFKKSYIDHCGIYAGNGYFVHCNASKDGITLDNLNASRYISHLVVAKRSVK